MEKKCGEKTKEKTETFSQRLHVYILIIPWALLPNGFFPVERDENTDVHNKTLTQEARWETETNKADSNESLKRVAN